MRASRRGRHISGAEGLFRTRADADAAAAGYARRAAAHPKGAPDSIGIAIERLAERPRAIKALPLLTLDCASPSEAKGHATALLRSMGVSDRAVRAAFRVLESGETMRGAALVDARSGRRLEPDRKRGVRASMMGIDKAARRALSKRLGRLGIDTDAVREALVLASKVASTAGVVAEICASDDPGYTTGYVASRAMGYVRLPNIKKKGSASGGRAFFIEAGADVQGAIKYLKETPVVVKGLLFSPHL